MMTNDKRLRFIELGNVVEECVDEENYFNKPCPNTIVSIG